VFGWFKLPNLIGASTESVMFWKGTHGFLAWALVAVISVHILAAFKHQFMDRDGVLRRMWFK
jgi:cytochrome b561